MGCSESTRARVEKNIESSITDSMEKDEKLIKTLSLYNKDLGQIYSLAQEEGEFSRLLDLLDDDSPLVGLRPCPRWAEIPSTTACVAISLLNKSLKVHKRPIDEEKLLSSSDMIVDMFLENNDALIQHTTYFIWKVCNNGYTSFNKKLISSNIFQYINKFLLHSKMKFRYLVLKLCVLLYKDNEEAKRLFCENKGVKNIMWQIYFCPLACLQFHKLLEFLKLLMTRQGDIDETFAVVVAKEIGTSFFTNFDVMKLSGKESEAFDEVLNILIYTRKTFDIRDETEE